MTQTQNQTPPKTAPHPYASPDKKIAYLGVPGSYSHQASLNCFPDATYRGMGKFKDILELVYNGEADYAVVPIENSTAGRVSEIYNLIPMIDLHIIGEYLMPIHHCLLVPSGAYRGRLPREMSQQDALAWKNSPLSDDEKATARQAITEIYSHPQALMQCAGYIDTKLPKAQTFESFDTATAARSLANAVDGKKAAIASPQAANVYNMLVIDDEIEDDKKNMTRFLVLAREALREEDMTMPAITTLLFQTAHQPGSLLKALESFAKYGINLTKLETYMISQDKPLPRFYVDVGGCLRNENMKQALREFNKHTANYNILGCYPASPDRAKDNSFLMPD